MKSPQISIIVPCYQQAQFLDDCLNSVLVQSFQEWECIIVNDGSDDNTEEIAKKWTFIDNRFKYISQKNKGLPSARNIGIVAAKSKWILPLDADDIISADYLDLAYTQFDNGYTVITCIGEKFGTDSGVIKMEDFSLKNLATYNTFFASSFFQKKDWERVNGYDISLIYGLEDWDFWISILQDGGKVYKINKTCFYYRMKQKSMITELVGENKILMTRIISKKHIDFFHKYLGDFPSLALEIKILKREREMYYNAYNSKRYKLGDRIVNCYERFFK